jgi:hypothetical protein
VSKAPPDDATAARIRRRAFAASPLMKAMRRALRRTREYLDELDRLAAAAGDTSLWALWRAAGVPDADPEDDDEVAAMLDVPDEVIREAAGVTWAVGYLHDHLASNTVRRPSRSR